MEQDVPAYIRQGTEDERKCIVVDRKVVAGNLAKKVLLLSVLFLGVQAVAKKGSTAVPDDGKKSDTFGSTMMESLAEGIGSMVYGQFLPGIGFSEESSSKACWLLQEQIRSLLPFYGFVTDRVAGGKEVSMDYRTLLLAEAEEGEYGQEDNYNKEEDWTGESTNQTGQLASNTGTDWQTGNNSAVPTTGSTNADWQTGGNGTGPTAGSTETNRQTGGNGTEPATGSTGADLAADGTAITGQDVGNIGETLEDLLRAENEAALQMQISSFIPHGIQNHVSMDILNDYDTLIQQFYSVDANTMAGSDQLNVNQFLQTDLTIPKDSPGPQILIYHTHSQEAFSDSIPGDEATSIMGVGDRLTEILTLDYGYEVLHHRGKYDVKSRDTAYANALPDIEQVLKDNPTIQVVIDLHRDAVPESTRLVMDLDGRPTARFMFFNGLSRTRKTGNIAYLYNKNLNSNLAFSFQMQLKAMEYYPGLTRKIYLKGYRYNMHLSSKYLLIELGAQNNTVEEAMNACDPLAHILDMVLSGEG